MHTSHRFNVASEAGAFFNRTCQTWLTVSLLLVCTGITVVQTPDDLPMYTELLDNSRARAVCRGQARGSADQDCMSHRVLSKSLGSQMKHSMAHGCSAFIGEVETPAASK